MTKPQFTVVFAQKRFEIHKGGLISSYMTSLIRVGPKTEKSKFKKARYLMVHPSNSRKNDLKITNFIK